MKDKQVVEVYREFKMVIQTISYSETEQSVDFRDLNTLEIHPKKL